MRTRAARRRTRRPRPSGHCPGTGPPEAAARARERGVAVREEGLLDHRLDNRDDGAYDAVLFTRSLHHIADLDAAVAHAVTLLAPGGALVLDEFAREQADRLSVCFRYEMLGLLGAVGIPVAVHDLDPAGDPFQRWRDDLAPSEGEPLHTGAAMRAAVGARTRVGDTAWVPYLWRHILDKLHDTGHDTGGAPVPRDRAEDVGRFLRTVERRRIAEGTMRPLGLRLVGRTYPKGR